MKNKKGQVWSINIPELHPSLNKWSRMHFFLRNKLKQELGELAFFCAKKAKVPKFDVPVEIFITYYHPRDVVDFDNYTPKFFLDGLKPFFKDDSIKFLKRLGWEFEKGEKRSVVHICEYEKKNPLSTRIALEREEEEG